MRCRGGCAGGTVPPAGAARWCVYARHQLEVHVQQGDLPLVLGLGGVGILGLRAEDHEGGAL